ncbi:MAG: hypothetical protein JO354_07910, partial [Verrucomicrobia bacterium]|nr:hypothetical protein [Verrucomicrobiota bacterium]
MKKISLVVAATFALLAGAGADIIPTLNTISSGTGGNFDWSYRATLTQDE